MANIRDQIWLLPFAGAILTAISIFTPTLVFHLGSYFWLQYMDGFKLIIGGGSGPSVGFFAVLSIMIIGIISTILIVICTIILFISALSHRGKEIPGSWIVIGIFLIGGTIFYIGGSELGYFIYRLIHYGLPGSFWRGGIPSFAVIAPFIGGGLSILSVIIGKSVGKEEVDITPVSKEAPSVSIDEPPIKEEISQPFPTAKFQSAKFCPVCGEKILSIEARFCPSCGNNLKK